jgi:hypothetical protein
MDSRKDPTDGGRTAAEENNCQHTGQQVGRLGQHAETACNRLLDKKITDTTMKDVRQGDPPMLPVSASAFNHLRAIAKLLAATYPSQQGSCNCGSSGSLAELDLLCLAHHGLGPAARTERIYCQDCPAQSQGTRIVPALPPDNRNVCYSVYDYLEARATRPVAAALAVRIDRAILTVLMRKGEIKLLLCGWVCEQGRTAAL